MRPIIGAVLHTDGAFIGALIDGGSTTVLDVSLGVLGLGSSIMIGAVSAELATEVAMRICASVLYEGIFEGRVVRQSFISWLDKVGVQSSR